MNDASKTFDEDRRAAATQVFVDAAVLASDGLVALDSDAQHHLDRVLRLREGERVAVCDGQGRWRLAVVVGSGDSFRIETDGAMHTVERTRMPLRLATAIPKGDRLDWLVQKAVEIGADTIQLLHTDRSVVRWKADRAAKQLERLRRIALEASRQSRRVWLPEVLAPVDASEVLSTSVAAEPGGRSVVPTDNSIAIGPEGGWSTDELKMASDQVQLGHNVLRTETAAIVAVTLYVTKS